MTDRFLKSFPRCRNSYGSFILCAERIYMTITTKFYPPFIACVNKLKEKYGEDFEKAQRISQFQFEFYGFH